MSLLAVSAARALLALDPAELAARPPADPALLPYRDVPALLTFAKANVSATLALSALLVVAGIGIVRRRRWGRTAGIVWAAGTLLTSLAGAVVNFGWHLPALSRATAGNADPAAVAAKYEAIVNGAGMTCVSLVMAVAYLVALHRPAVRAELASPASASGPGPGSAGTGSTTPPGSPGG